MFTLACFSILLAAIVGGVNYGLTAEVIGLFVTSGLFGIAGAITTAGLTLAEKFGDKK